MFDHFAVRLHGIRFGYDVLGTKFQAFPEEIFYLVSRIDDRRDMAVAHALL